MLNITIDHVLHDKKIAQKLFYHLSDHDVRQCALVNRTWYLATRASRAGRKLRLTVELLADLRKRGEKLEDYVKNNYRNAIEVDIYGWSSSTYIQNEVYDNVLNHFKPKRLILRGRGSWDSCHCPREGSLCGEQINSTNSQQLTSLESIYVGSTFCISSCALLDLVSRSPKLKFVRFHGLICKNDHNNLFNRKHFHCDLQRLYWPWPGKLHLPTMTTLVRRNENLTTFFSNAETTTDLLAAEVLPNLRFLSLSLNENWRCKTGHFKRINKYVQKLQYISTAKNLEALEIRTFDIVPSDNDETNAMVERIYENYKLTFWEHVAKLPRLKYLAIYGSWEFEKVARDMAKQNLNIEYLKINLIPNSIILALDAQDDTPIMSMVDGIRNLKKLPKLKSLHYICFERLGSIDTQTVTAFKEIMDLLWVLDIKTCYTEEIEDLLNNIMRRGNQLGKTYRYYIHIQSKAEHNHANLLSEKTLKYPLGTNLQEKIASVAELETSQRYRKSAYENFQIWGLELVGNHRDKAIYEYLASHWKLYNEQFSTDMYII